MSRPSQRVAATALAAVLLGACSPIALGGGSARGPDSAVRPEGSKATVVSLDPRDLPAPLADREVVDPDWDAVPHEAAGVFVGLGQITEDALRFSATASDGTVLWTTERPLSCTGFALTSDGDRALAVLADLTPGTRSVAVTTASAYDLITGEQVWGPVEVPGPHVGPGLVFAEQIPEGGAMGASGPRVALDPATGAVAATEEDLGGDRLVGEHHGTLLVATSDELVARDATDGDDRWRLPLTDLGVSGTSPVQAAPDTTPGDGMMFVGDREGYALLDLTGRRVARGALDTATDPSTGVHVTVDHDLLRGYDTEGDLRWEHPIERGTRIASAGSGVVYLREGGRILTRDTSAGERVEVYGTPSETGAAHPACGLDGRRRPADLRGTPVATTEPAGTVPDAAARSSARAP